MATLTVTPEDAAPPMEIMVDMPLAVAENPPPPSTEQRLTVIEKLWLNQTPRLDVTATLLRDELTSQFDELLEALKGNKSVTVVHVSGHMLDQLLTDDEIARLLEAVANLTNLQELFVFSGKLLKEDSLARALRGRAPYVRVLMLWGFRLKNNVLAGVLRHMPRLERITLTMPPKLSWSSLDVYVMGLASHHQLQCVSIRVQEGHHQTQAIVSPEALRLLMHSQSIDSLYLENCGLTDEHCDVVAEELRTNQALTLVDLKDNLLTDDALYSMGGMLPHNKTLKSLDLSGVLISEGGGKRLAEGMAKNQKLQHLEIEGTLERYQDEFDIPVGHTETAWWTAIDYQIRLNRAGHGQRNDRRRFVESLVSVSDNLDCLIHFTTCFAQHFDRSLY